MRIKDNNFRCDNNSKWDFSASTLSHILTAFTSIVNVKMYELGSNNERVEFGKGKTEATTDIIADFYFNNGSVVSYICELKERDYPSDKFSNGWILECDKERSLMTMAKEGYIPLYVNLFPDDKVIIWNLNRVNYKRDNISIWAEKKTKSITPKTTHRGYGLKNKDGIIIERVRVDDNRENS